MKFVSGPRTSHCAIVGCRVNWTNARRRDFRTSIIIIIFHNFVFFSSTFTRGSTKERSVRTHVMCVLSIDEKIIIFQSTNYTNEKMYGLAQCFHNTPLERWCIGVNVVYDLAGVNNNILTITIRRWFRKPSLWTCP